MARHQKFSGLVDDVHDLSRHRSAVDVDVEDVQEDADAGFSLIKRFDGDYFAVSRRNDEISGGRHAIRIAEEVKTECGQDIEWQASPVVQKVRAGNAHQYAGASIVNSVGNNFQTPIFSCGGNCISSVDISCCSMTISEILILDFDAEIVNTRRTLERIPEHDPQWKPDVKSMPIGRLALHTARLPDFCTTILTTPTMDMAQSKFPALTFESTEHLLAELERSSEEARAHLTTATDGELQTVWKLSFGERVFAEGPRMLLYRTIFLNHMVHHRAQLGVYLRLLQIPVPGLYGPSADEPVRF